jgi:hypothetical protein
MPIKKELQNPGGINTGNALERTTCPVHVSVLKDLYEVQAMGTPGIANWINGKFNTKFDRASVYRWWKSGGIQTRTHSHASSIACKQNPEMYKRIAALGNIASAKSEIHKQIRMKIMKKIGSKGNKAHLKACLARRIIVQCALCGKDKSLMPCKYKGPTRHFCNLSHSATYYRAQEARERLEAKLTAPLRDIEAAREADVQKFRRIAPLLAGV